MARNTWVVIPATEHWVVRPKNAEQPAEYFAGKDEAVRRAREIAGEHRPSDVVVQDQGSELRVEAEFD